jgi:HEPN domain-containing protein
MSEKDPGKINRSELTNHLIDISENDYSTMMILYKSGSYNWALFLGHISLEKLLKAL